MRPTTIEHEGLRAFVEGAGGVVRAAKLLRVSRWTLRRWGTFSIEPSAAEQRRANGVARRKGLHEPFGETT